MSQSTPTGLSRTPEQETDSAIMHLYVVERVSGKRVKTISVKDEADATVKFRELSRQFGGGIAVDPDIEFNWRDHSIDAAEVWLDPRHPPTG